jgi:hypothetical protein
LLFASPSEPTPASRREAQARIVHDVVERYGELRHDNLQEICRDVRAAMVELGAPPPELELAERVLWEAVFRTDRDSVIAAFVLTDEEQERLAETGASKAAASWWRLAVQLHGHLLDAYGAGEITFERLLKSMRACSLGCTFKDRAWFLALTVERALRITPNVRKRGQPQRSLWVKRLAVVMFELLRDLNPDLPLWPDPAARHATDRTVAHLTAKMWQAVGLSELASFEPATLRRHYTQVAEKKGRQPSGTSRDTQKTVC